MIDMRLTRPGGAVVVRSRERFCAGQAQVGLPSMAASAWCLFLFRQLAVWHTLDGYGRPNLLLPKFRAGICVMDMDRRVWSSDGQVTWPRRERERERDDHGVAEYIQQRSKGVSRSLLVALLCNLGRDHNDLIPMTP